MAIEFHCDHCGKLVRTAAEHAGKRGRCPACHQSVYIPTPSDQIEPLKLTPLDQRAERERERLERESRELALRLAQESDRPPLDEAPRTPGDSDLDMLPPRMDMETLVIEYAICMADGNLAEAEELAIEIRKNMAAADAVIERLMMDEIPPAQLVRIPRPVLVGFFKQLHEGR